MKNIATYFCLLMLLISPVKADGDHDAPANKNGAAKAYEEGEFSITEKAEKRLGVKWLNIQGKGPWKVPSETIMRLKFTKAAYRKFEGRITMIVLETVKQEGDFVWINSPDLEPGDEIAIKGVKYLRLTELDLFQGAVDSCG